MEDDSKDRKRQVSETIEAVVHGSGSAVDRLMPAVYEELHLLAERYLARERAGHTLSATALVHDAYLRLVDQTRVEWKGRAHFLAVAAQAVRRVLVDHARAHGREKRGGGLQRLTLSGVDPAASEMSLDVLALHEALQRLEDEEPAEVRIVVMRFFGGMTEEEIAEVLDVSASTVRRRWRFAKTWLRRQISLGNTQTGGGGL